MLWNGTITVTLNDNEEEGLHSLQLDHILYFQLYKRKVFVHTARIVYLCPWNSMKMLYTLLSSSTNRFEKADKDAIINVNNIKRLDNERLIAYFDDNGEYPDKYCYIANVHYPTIKRRLEEREAHSAQ